MFNTPAFAVHVLNISSLNGKIDILCAFLKGEFQRMSLVPMVVERSGNSERSYDIFSRL